MDFMSQEESKEEELKENFDNKQSRNKNFNNDAFNEVYISKVKIIILIYLQSSQIVESDSSSLTDDEANAFDPSIFSQTNSNVKIFSSSLIENSQSDMGNSSQVERVGEARESQDRSSFNSMTYDDSRLDRSERNDTISSSQHAEDKNTETEKNPTTKHVKKESKCILF